jgi:NTE family protein
VNAVPETLEPPRDVVARLGLIDVFADLSRELRAQVATELEWWRFRAGETIFRENDATECAYLIVRGRVRVVQVGAEGNERVIGERGAGEPIGEVGLLAAVARTATVRAIRDTDALRIDRATFERLLRARPETMVPLVRVVSERLAEALRGGVPQVRAISTLAIVRDPEVPDGRRVAEQLISAVSRRVDLLRLDATTGELDPGSMVEAIDAQEARRGVTCFEIDPAGERLATDALRQADCVVFVGTPRGRSPTVQRVVTALDEMPGEARRILVLVHGQGGSAPKQTSSLIDGFDRHHHIRAGASSDVDRVARHVMDQAVGLVLSGGGARAMAHVGAYRALTEAGVPIDHVGGSSIGGVLAAQIASGWSPAELDERNRDAWPSLNLGRRFTIPLLSLLSPAAARRMLEEMFGAAELEDLWLPSFVTAVDLTRCHLRICRNGPVARWTLATQAAPGLWPPVVDEDGALFIDGGVIDNLPVLPMREEGPQRVIAIDVSRRRPFTAGTSVATAPSPLTFVRDRLRRNADRHAHEFPGLLQVLNRTAVVTSLERHAQSRMLTDVYAEPDVGTIGIAEYSTFGQAVSAGYEATRRAIDENEALLTTWA